LTTTPISALRRLFATVEVNTTFNRLISLDAVQRWVQQTPQDFSFAVKVSRYLSHVKRLADMREGLARFYERIEPLVEAKRLGPVLWQLPETFHRDEQRLAEALAALPAGRHAFEFRHPSWFVPEVYALLREHDAALVIGDHPDRGFQSYEATAGWRYVRFRAAGVATTSDSELQEWANRLHSWRAQSEIFIYFNNDWEIFAPRNAARSCPGTSRGCAKTERSSHIHERSDYEHEDAHALRCSVCDALPAIYGFSRILNALSSFFWKISYACGASSSGR
jgi:uncharacterized protein YecE (DUF72 family)